MDQTKVDVRHQLQNFKPTKGRFDSLLLEYSPLMVLAQLNLAGLALILGELYRRLSPNPQLVTWAVFSPVYAGVLLTLFAEAMVIRSFLKRIPATFAQLWEGHVLERSGTDEQISGNFIRFLDQFEQKLNSRQRLWLGLPLAVLGLIFFWNTGHLPYILSRWFDGSDWITKLVITTVNVVTLFLPAVAVGYATGIGAWKNIVTAIFVRRFSRVFDLSIQPSSQSTWF